MINFINTGNEMAKKEIKEGICALVKKHGVYVKSHLIPKSLTLITSNGEMRIEASLDTSQRTKRRYDSWFDIELCIRDGEDILEKIDNNGINILREYQLIWSGWDIQSFNIGTFMPFDESKTSGFRILESNQEKEKILQLFFLSLLWRAAATKIPEFNEIQLDNDILEDLRLRIINLDPGNFEDYPIMLFPIINKGNKHNRTPDIRLQTDETIPPIANREYARFYFDGLVIHIFLPKDIKIPENAKALFLGMGEKLCLSCKDINDSLVNDEMNAVLKAHQNTKKH